MVTKQFVALFILVVIAIFAGIIFTNIAIFESSMTYDVTNLVQSMFSFVDIVVVFKLGEQDAAINNWIFEATVEVQQAEAELFFWNDYIFEVING
jgi:ABC-type proline/glycine betaine transport system permease subunit